MTTKYMGKLTITDYQGNPSKIKIRYNLTPVRIILAGEKDSKC